METATQTLHRLTSYEPGREWDEPIDDPRVVQDLEVNDLERFPWFYKRYPQELPRLGLPRSLPPTTAPALAVLAGTADVTSTDLDLPQLARLLYLSAGVVRTAVRPYATWLFRAAGSAGGRFPLEVYVAVPEGTDLPAGVHWYDPLEHALVQVGPAAARRMRRRWSSPASRGAPAGATASADFRHVYWDAGTMLAQLLAVADSAGVGTGLFTRFPDAVVADLVGADGVHEWPVAVVALGDGTPAIESSGAAAVGAVDAAPLEFPLVTSAQRAGDLDAFGRSWDRGSSVDVPVDGPTPMEAVVLSRGSQRRMDATRSLPERTLRSCMLVATRGIDVPHRRRGPQRRRTRAGGLSMARSLIPGATRRAA